jgi:AcrR family transcriptional regulator
MANRERTDRGQDEYLDAVIATLAANPGASLQEIADAIGISRATLHRRFSSRDELLMEVGDWAITQLEGISDSVESRNLHGRAALEAILEEAIQLAPKIGFLISEYSLECNAELMGRVDTAQQRWHRLIEEGQRNGEIRVDLPARWIADAIEGLMLAVFHGIRRGLTAPNDALRLVRITLLDGVLTTPIAPATKASSVHVSNSPASVPTRRIS